jgi:hypothetical protein
MVNTKMHYIDNTQAFACSPRESLLPTEELHAFGRDDLLFLVVRDIHGDPGGRSFVVNPPPLTIHYKHGSNCFAEAGVGNSYYNCD